MNNFIDPLLIFAIILNVIVIVFIPWTIFTLFNAAGFVFAALALAERWS